MEDPIIWNTIISAINAFPEFEFTLINFIKKAYSSNFEILIKTDWKRSENGRGKWHDVINIEKSNSDVTSIQKVTVTSYVLK